MAGHDLGIVLGKLEQFVDAADHPIDAAAVGKVDVGIATEKDQVAGDQHVGVGKIDIGVAVSVHVHRMPELGRAALEPHCHGVLVDFLWQRDRRRRRHQVAGESVAAPAGKTALDVLVRHDGGAILAERLVAAGMIAMEMGDDEVADRLAGQRRDGGLDLAVQRRELAVHHDDAVIGDRDGDVAALAFEHIGLVAEIPGFDHDRIKIRRRRDRLELGVCMGAEHDDGRGRSRSRQSHLHGGSSLAGSFASIIDREGRSCSRRGRQSCNHGQSVFTSARWSCAPHCKLRLTRKSTSSTRRPQPCTGVSSISRSSRC